MKNNNQQKQKHLVILPFYWKTNNKLEGRDRFMTLILFCFKFNFRHLKALWKTRTSGIVFGNCFRYLMFKI